LLAIDLRDTVSFVTGAARGIGRACAEALAQAGSHIAVVDLDESAASSTARAIADAHGVRAQAYGCDVRDAAAIRTVVDRVASDFGGLDHVVNNAGVQFVSPIGDFPEQKFADVRAIDFDSVFHTSKAAWPHLLARERGRIVNIASVQGLIGSPFKIAYCAAKHGVVGMTKVLAIEGAPHNITANAICPGAVLTDLVRNQAPGLVQSYGGGITEEQALERAFLDAMPSKRFIDPSEVGALCAYLCSDFAVSITGAPVSIDGGWAAH